MRAIHASTGRESKVFPPPQVQRLPVIHVTLVQVGSQRFFQGSQQERGEDGWTRPVLVGSLEVTRELNRHEGVAIILALRKAKSRLEQVTKPPDEWGLTDDDYLPVDDDPLFR